MNRSRCSMGDVSLQGIGQPPVGQPLYHWCHPCSRSDLLPMYPVCTVPLQYARIMTRASAASLSSVPSGTPTIGRTSRIVTSARRAIERWMGSINDAEPVAISEPREATTLSTLGKRNIRFRTIVTHIASYYECSSQGGFSVASTSRITCRGCGGFGNYCQSSLTASLVNCLLWFGPFAEQRVESSQHLDNKLLRDRTETCALAGLPIEALHLIRQYHACYGESVRQPNFEGVALHLAGNRTE